MCDIPVPKVKADLGLIIFIINIVLPGCGTIWAGCAGSEGTNNTVIIWGIAELLTSWLLVGWCLSIYHGWLIYEKSK